MGNILGWIWTALAAGAAVRLFQPDQALTAAALLLSAVAACPPVGARLKLNGLVQVGLVVLFAGLGVLSFVHGRKPVAVVQAAPKTLLETGANGGITKTASFTTPGAAWSMDWSYDCSVLGDSGNFHVKVTRKDGSASANAAVEKIGDHDSGTEHYKEGGTFYLDVTSECPWHVRVAG